MRTTESFSRSTLATGRIKQMIDAAARQGVQAISFTGGEPLLEFERLIDLIQHAGDAGIPFIRTGTNGFVFRHPQRSNFESRIARMADQLADTPLRNFWISLDSAVDQVHEQMRGFPGAVAGIAKALPIFHRAGIYPAVNLGINRNVGGEATRQLARFPNSSDATYLSMFYQCYRKAFERFYQRVVDLGFTIANTCYPMSIDEPDCNQGLNAVYAATAVDDIVRFSAMEKQMLFKALLAAIRRYRSKIRIFSPLCALEALVRQYRCDALDRLPYGCRGGVDFFYVNAVDGHVYPCGYRGNDDFGVLEAIDIGKLDPAADANACRQCDWECFRDPSELFGPLLECFSNPAGLIRRMIGNPAALTTWVGDMAYYHACDFFNGRRPPNYRRLKRFARSSTQDHIRITASTIGGRFNRNLSVS
jgi:MoaA/NifB/PqqE/SkfB family radical SAM enzyme